MPTVTPPRAPKYIALAESLTADIDSGLLKPGDRLPTFDELRSRFSVAISTLDRAFMELEQNGLVRREPGRGVFVTEKKSELKGVIGLVGFGNMAGSSDSSVVSPGKFTPYFYTGHLMEGLDTVIQQHDLRMMLLNQRSSTGWDMVDGVLIHAQTSNRLDELRERLPDRIPIVSVINSSETVSAAMADDFNGARNAVQYLIQLGHRRIGCLMSRTAQLPMLRLAGYRQALFEADIEPQSNWVIPLAHDEDSAGFINWGRESIRQWLVGGQDSIRCTALLVQNDWVAIGAMEALQEAGLRVPEDISVIGFDGTQAGELTTPKITSVEVPIAQIAQSGLELLLRKIETGSSLPNETIVLPTRLQIRESTAPHSP
jgi:DNA-binding LacI/PurR family transcriptional regulator